MPDPDLTDERLAFLREQRENDLRAVAATAEGRRVLASLVSDALVLGGPFTGDGRDGYREGRRHAAVEFREELKGVLPRDAFVKIICPVEE
ncbi:MAG: hypothetical protein LIQ30_06940 [Planctomycetes bacterium]|nr:hypothetical protein [Planctomycetota bacterium]MCD7896956.1 hypothetical protein [Planctomycetaceae bacterium]